MAKSDAIGVLNDLIKTSEDGELGFQEAAKVAHDPRVVSLFRECAQECHTATDQLQAKVTSLGGKPAHGGSMTGAAHRGWITAKSKVAESDLSVLEEVERGEDYAKASYSKALKADLPSDIHELIERQAAGAIRNHDRIRDLRNNFRSQTHAH